MQHDRALFFDTETTGLIPKRGEGGEQPHLVQLGALLVVDGHESALFSCLIRPDGWEIPAEATKIHGITTEMCEQAGLDLVDALMVFKELAWRAGRIVAHNYEFDACLLDIEFHRLGQAGFLFGDGRQYCTMKAATQIVKAQGKNSQGSFTKYPKLIEAHQFFLGAPFEGIHTAIGDVRACRAVFDAMQKWIADVNAKSQSATNQTGTAGSTF